MRITRALEFEAGSKKEKLPYASSDFPYVASRAELDYYRDNLCQWHWHEAVEIFYVESGALTYHTPHKEMHFSKGEAGFVNSNVLHMSEFRPGAEKNVLLLHIFEPALISGGHKSLITSKFITPVIGSSGMEMLKFKADAADDEAELVDMIRSAFSISEKEFGYELRIREALSSIWLGIIKLSHDKLDYDGSNTSSADDKIKKMMVYIHEHYNEKIAIAELARSAFVSERECFRIFQSQLHMTPTAYIQSYRLEAARQLLADTAMPVTEVGYLCGLGSSSYFGKVFRTSTGYTPSEYRHKWQDSDKS